jgi:cytochrome c556
MTSDKDKIDAKLRAEIERLERARQADEPIAVVVEPVKGGEAGARAARDHIWTRLQEIKVKDARQLALANALVARLTADQIRTLAEDDRVGRIFMDAAERVTLG